MGGLGCQGTSNWCLSKKRSKYNYGGLGCQGIFNLGVPVPHNYIKILLFPERKRRYLRCERAGIGGFAALTGRGPFFALGECGDLRKKTEFVK